MAAAVIIYLWINRDTQIEGTELLLPQFAMPGILAGVVFFTLILGPAGQLAQEREDGTLLRMRAIPRGITGYLSGQLLQHPLNILPMLLLPIQQLWTWVQYIAQVFPMYWLSLGMRSAFLPDEVAGVLEIGGTWRTWQTIAVLAAWAIAGTLITPATLRRMTRRQSGATLTAAREAAATQGVR